MQTPEDDYCITNTAACFSSLHENIYCDGSTTHHSQWCITADIYFLILSPF